MAHALIVFIFRTLLEIRESEVLRNNVLLANVQNQCNRTTESTCGQPCDRQHLLRSLRRRSWSTFPECIRVSLGELVADYNYCVTLCDFPSASVCSTTLGSFRCTCIVYEGYVTLLSTHNLPQLCPLYRSLVPPVHTCPYMWVRPHA